MGISAELISLLRFLLPGFFLAWVFYGLTPYERSSQFERVVQALIFTLVVQAELAILAELWPSTFDFEPEGAFGSFSDLVTLFLATFTGITFALLANKDWLHRFLR